MKPGWINAALGDVCDIYQPKTISSKDLVPDGPYPVFGANGVIGRYSLYNHEQPQLLITCRGATCGSVNISEPFSWVTGNAMVVRPKLPDLSLRFVEYFFRGVVDLDGVITGAAQPQITRTTLAPVRISYPPLEEQQRIVGILDEVFEGLDRARASAEANLKNAKTLLALQIEQELFSTKEQGKPTTIGAICSHMEYGTASKSLPTGKMPVLRMGNIQNGELDWSDLVYSDEDAEIKKLILKPFDVLFNRTNSLEHVGKTAIYRDERPAIFAGYLIRLHYKRDVVNPEFLNLFLNSDAVRAHGRMISGKSVNQANISGSKLKDYKINLPSLDVQGDIVQRIDRLKNPLNSLKQFYAQKLQDLDDLRQSLLQKAFAGELT